jgi:hypothetical protein
MDLTVADEKESRNGSEMFVGSAWEGSRGKAGGEGWRACLP